LLLQLCDDWLQTIFNWGLDEGSHTAPPSEFSN